MTRYKALFDALKAPFRPDEEKTLPKANRPKYVTARTVMNRLDEVLGPEGWRDTYIPHEHSVVCRLTITLPDGKELTKEDAGGGAGMKDEGDDDKSAFSDAFKRAAVKFGVGRYLYGDGVPILTDAGTDVGSVETQSEAGIANHGSQHETSEIQAPAQASPSEPARSESEGLTREQEQDLQDTAEQEAELLADDVPYWDHLNRRVTAANMEYRKMHPRSLPPVVLRDAIKSVAFLTKKAGFTDIDLEQKRTGKQWEVELSVMAGKPESREWMVQALESHINVCFEKANANIRKPTRVES